MIWARCTEKLTLAELANSVGLTSFQTIGLLKRTFGITPHVLLTRLRLDLACNHLRRGLSLAESACAVGFYDQSALTRHSKHCYGITPLQFWVAVRTRG